MLGGVTKPFQLPSQLPMIVLDRVYLLPGGIQPLYIFEQRYRDMLNLALSTSRMFAIGDRRRDGSLRLVTTAGLITSSFQAADGTSQLILQGIHRMRITGLEQEEPFIIASVEPITTDREPAEEIIQLAEEADRLIGRIISDEIKDHLSELRQMMQARNDPAYTCDLIASLAVHRPSVSRAILEEKRLVRRLRLLLKEMKRCEE
jgi:Lon protease-like protein